MIVLVGSPDKRGPDSLIVNKQQIIMASAKSVKNAPKMKRELL
jgi:hypothetical protein